MRNRDGSCFDQRSEPFFGVDVFACANRGVDSSLESGPLVDKLPRNHVFVPSEGVFIESLTDSYRTFDVHVPEVVGRQRNFISDGVADSRHEFAHLFDPVIGDLNSAERVHRVHRCLDETFVDNSAFILGGDPKSDVHL